MAGDYLEKQKKNLIMGDTKILLNIKLISCLSKTGRMHQKPYYLSLDFGQKRIQLNALNRYFYFPHIRILY